MSTRAFFDAIDLVDLANRVLAGPNQVGQTDRSRLTSESCGTYAPDGRLSSFNLAVLERRNRKLEEENAELRRQLAEQGH